MRTIFSAVLVSAVFLIVAGNTANLVVASDSEAALEERVERLEAELAEYRRTWPGYTDAQEKTTAADSTAPIAAASAEEPLYSNAEDLNCPPEFQLQDVWETLDDSRFPTLKWSGFIQVDTGWIVQDEAGKAALGSVNSQAGLRRVRLRVDGNVRENAAYAVDLDFAASGHPSFRDAKLVFHDIPTLQNLQLGLFKQSFSMSGETSGRELVFMERQLPFAFDPFRQFGLGAYGTAAGERITWAASLYGYPTDSFGVTEDNGSGNSLGSRLTILPFYADEGRRLVHVGFAYHLGSPANNLVRYSIQPGFFVSEGTESGSTGVPTIVDTGDIPTDTFNLFNVELAGGFGPFSIQSEASFSLVNQLNNPTALFSGVAVNCAYVLTGEIRPYDRAHGVFHDVVPFRPFAIGSGGGAWELTAGWSYIDLNDENILGGRANEAVFGITWYLGQRAKLMLNVIPSLINTPGFGKSKMLVTAMRGQIEF